MPTKINHLLIVLIFFTDYLGFLANFCFSHVIKTYLKRHMEQVIQEEDPLYVCGSIFT
jgi:hypothetical protein